MLQRLNLIPLFIVVSVLFIRESRAQEGNAVSVTENGSDVIETLDSVSETISILNRQIAEKRADVASAETDAESEQLNAELSLLNEKKQEARANFDSIAAGVSIADFDAASEQSFVLKDEVDELLEPLVKELKDITSRPREMEQLRSDLDLERARVATAEAAIGNIDRVLGEITPTHEFQSELAASRSLWSDRKAQAANRIRVLDFRLKELDSSGGSVFHAASNGVRSFFQNRGKNFLIAILSFAVIFGVFRFFHRRLHRFGPWNRKERRNFYTRLIDVGFHLLTLIGATGAAILVLYAAGDWVLLGVAIIILVGAVVAAKNAIPKFYDQGRLLLNLGEVREAERLIYQGVPWKVETLGVFSRLVNPALRGGLLRLPIRQLSDLVSRPIGANEPWFPSEEGDWVELADGNSGRVILQTPEVVQLVKLGGARISYPTAEYFTQMPQNISADFRIATTFGIDYKHQADCTEKIPEMMWSFINPRFCAAIGGHEKLKTLKIEFQTAGASSLDYILFADLDGELASRKTALTRVLQRLAVDSCNEYGWEIPFTQITMHQASSEVGESQ